MEQLSVEVGGGARLDVAAPPFTPSESLPMPNDFIDPASVLAHIAAAPSVYHGQVEPDEWPAVASALVGRAHVAVLTTDRDREPTTIHVFSATRIPYARSVPLSARDAVVRAATWLRLRFPSEIQIGGSWRRPMAETLVPTRRDTA